MYAIIENGNKQYKVAEGDVVRVEKLAAKEGETVSFNTLMVSDGNGWIFVPLWRTRIFPASTFCPSPRLGPSLLASLSLPLWEEPVPFL